MFRKTHFTVSFLLALEFENMDTNTLPPKPSISPSIASSFPTVKPFSSQNSTTSNPELSHIEKESNASSIIISQQPLSPSNISSAAPLDETHIATKASASLRNNNVSPHIPSPSSFSSSSSSDLDKSMLDEKHPDSEDITAVSLSTPPFPESIDVARFSSEEKKILSRIRRKLDLRIITCLWITYFLSRSVTYSISLSLTMNKHQGHSLLQTVSGLNYHTLSVGTGLSYVSLIIFDLPSNLLMTRADPRLWLSRIQVTTGIIGACHAVLGTKGSSASGFIALRFFNGLAIAGMWPGFAFYTSRFYRDQHLGKRIGWYYTAAQISSVATSLLSAAFQKMDGLHGLYGYQWMFLIWGVVAFTQGLFLPRWLPCIKHNQHNEKWISWIRIPKFLGFLKASENTGLTPEEEEVHAIYMAEMQVGKSWTLTDLADAFLDVRLWPPIFMFFGVVGISNGLVNYSSLIISEINENFSSVTVSLLVAPIWVFDAIAILTVLPLHDRFHKKMLFFVGSCLFVLAGLLITTFVSNVWGRYVGLLILGFGLGPTVPIIMTWVSSAMGPSHGDVGVAAGLAIVSGLGNLGSVVATSALYSGWKADTTFRRSNETMCGMVGIAIVASIVMHMVQKFNIRRFPFKRIYACLSERRKKELSVT